MTWHRNPELEAAFVELRADPKLNTYEIADKMGINYVTLNRWAHEMELPPRKNWRRTPRIVPPPAIRRSWRRG